MRSVSNLCCVVALAALSQFTAFGQSANPCIRYPEGSAITEPVDLFSTGGVLRLQMSYETQLDRNGNRLYCFVMADGTQSPTLHVRPGDTLSISLKNGLPSSTASNSKHTMSGMVVSGSVSTTCGAVVMTDSSVNIHYHGTNVPPVCHQDEAIRTLVNAGESFEYNLRFPADEPPGLYWYHPHVHGIAESAVQGGASGAIIVDGIENVNPAVAGLPERVLIVRDNLVPGNPDPGGAVPAWDISLNYTPVSYPDFKPVIIPIKPLEKQFWRVLNASADTILNLQVQYDGVAQLLDVVGLDGVPTGSQDGASKGTSISRKELFLAPANRAEFVITGPSTSVRNATLLTLNVNTGPFGDNDPQRPIATLLASADAPSPVLKLPPAARVAAGAHAAALPAARFAGLAAAPPVVSRKLYFSEVPSNPADPASPTNFFITVDGQTPAVFNPSNPPAIVTTQGSVEDWTIENHALENHEFHIHQIHFLVLEQNGVPVSNGQFLDTINVPFWSGTGPFPSVKVRMDFRGQITGDFVYHCHILGHEDNGMMAIIRVDPR